MVFRLPEYLHGVRFVGNHHVVRVAGPDAPCLPLAERDAHAVQALDEGRTARQESVDFDSHAGHNAHVDGHVGAVRDLDADFGEGSP
jgi:hypothetical protein